MEEGKITMTLYLDLAKAFDTLNHTIGLDKLKFHVIQCCLLNSIKNYLANKTKCAEINNVSSDFTNILTDVPQGFRI